MRLAAAFKAKASIGSCSNFELKYVKLLSSHTLVNAMLFSLLGKEPLPSVHTVTCNGALRKKEALQASLFVFGSAVLSCHALLTERLEEATREKESFRSSENLGNGEI